MIKDLNSPANTTTEESIDRVHHMLMNDNRLIRNPTDNIVSKTCEKFQNTLSNELDMTKAHAQLVPLYSDI